MSKNVKDSLNYTKYKTICVLPGEILEAYHDEITIEKIQQLYEKVMLLLLELPEEEAQKQMEQVGQFLQDILEGKQKTREQNMSAQEYPKRPRLKAKCANCQHTTYLQFTDGYYCPNCQKIYVEHLSENNKKIQKMMNMLQSSEMWSINEEEKNFVKTINDSMNNLQPGLNVTMYDELHMIQEMLKLDANSAQLQLRLGMYYYQRMNYAKALECYEKALELDDRDGVIFAAIGAVHLELGKIYDMNVEIGHTDLEGGDYERAVHYFEKSMEQWKKNEYSSWHPEIMFANYAIALQKTGNQQMAFELFKMARASGYPMYSSLVEEYEIGKEIYETKICERMESAIRIYSENLKVDINTLKRVRKYFKVPQEVKIYGFFDYTVFGSSREGVAVASDGIYFKTLMPKVHCIKWYELFEFDMEYKNCIQLKAKSGKLETTEICFQTLTDAMTFMEVLNEMQNL